VSHSKTINLKQYLNTNNFSVNNSCQDYIKNNFSSEILIKLTLPYTVQSQDENKMQYDRSDILFSAFKNTFVMKGFVCFTDIFIYKQLSCHEFIKKSIFETNIDKINNF
jgi:hypothetical protein